MEAPMTNPTETLRAAATLLREMAQGATPGPWRIDGRRVVYERDGWSEMVTPILHISADATFIATLDPTFAVLVADWLDAAVWFLERSHSASKWSRAVTERRLRHQMLIARHVLGEEVPQIAPTHGQERPKPANVGTGE